MLQVLWTGLVAGLAAHVAGYLLRASAPSDLVGLLADLRHTPGSAMRTGVVVVLMVEIIPRAKELDDLCAGRYEAAVRYKASTARGTQSTPGGSTATKGTGGPLQPSDRADG